MALHVIQIDNQFLVVEEFSTKNGKYQGVIDRGQFDTLSEANQFIEDSIPVNNVGGGHIAGVSPGENPPVRRKQKTIFFRRKKPR